LKDENVQQEFRSFFTATHQCQKITSYRVGYINKFSKMMTPLRQPITLYCTFVTIS